MNLIEEYFSENLTQKIKAPANTATSLSLYKAFFNSDVEKINQALVDNEESFWIEAGKRRALNLFHEVASSVPAYRDFLKKHKIKPEKIKSFKDFKEVPFIDKKNYLTKYPLKDLCWGGSLSSMQIISSSSGSTGKPFFWPRETFQEIEGAQSHELLYRYFFEIDKYKTLLIIGFSMGMWIAGTYTLSSSTLVSQKGYPLMILAPGINKKEIKTLIRELSSKFEQTILIGYPPFIKDIIDEGEKEGIDWKKIKTRFLFAGEGFNETWREYVLEKSGSTERLRDSMNIYGTADAAMIGHETPISILIRMLATGDLGLTQAVFGEERVPSVVQYNPLLRFFELIGDELSFTSRSGIPLIRYNIHDRGGILKLSEIKEAFSEYGYNLNDEIGKYKISEIIWNLPFVYLFGRSDFTATLYAVNIYPENIKAALEDRRVSNFVSGKFVMSTEYRPNQDQYLLLRIELASGTKPSNRLKSAITTAAVDNLKVLNTEYARLCEAVEERAIPEVKLYLNGDPKYFSTGIKHKWAKKEKKL